MSTQFSGDNNFYPSRDGSSPGGADARKAATAVVARGVLWGVDSCLAFQGDTGAIIANAVWAATDDVVINAALAYLNGLTGGGTVFLDEETYTINNPIQYPGNNLTVQGSGRGTFLDGDGLATGEHVIEIRGYTDCVVRDLSLQTNDGGGLNCDCIFIEDGAHRFGVFGVTFVNSDRYGIRVEGTTITGGTIAGNLVIDADEYAISLTSDGANFKYYIHITGNTVLSGNFGIALQAGVNYCTIDGNSCTGATNAGIFVGASWNTIVGNTCISNASYGIYLSAAHNSTVSGNVAALNTQMGIFISTSNYVVTTGNVAYLNVQHGIYYSGSDWGVIIGNQCNENDSGNTASYDGINSSSADNNTLIIGNHCYGNRRHGIWSDGERETVSGNYCTLNDRNGIVLRNIESSAIGNYCYDNGQDAAGTYHELELEGTADRCLIQGNIINSPGDSSEDCIHLQDGAVNVQIIGNYCYNGMGSGIALTANNDNCFIHGNYCSTNDDYGIEITAATCNDTSVIANYSVGNVTGARLDNGTSTYSENNWAGGIVPNSLGWSFATIQGAIDDVEASTAGGSIFVPVGTWDETLTIEDDEITLYGLGVPSLIQPSGAGVCITVSGDFDNVSIRNLAVDSKTGAGGSDAILLEDGCDRLCVEHVTIVNSDNYGIRVAGTNITDLYIHKCNFLSGDASGIYVDMDGANLLSRSSISHNLFTGLGGSGIRFDTTGGVSLYILIGDNIITGSTLSGLMLEDVSFSTIHNNIIYSNTLSGVYLGTATQLVFASNHVYLNIQHGVILVNADHNNFTSNMIWGNDADNTTTFNGIDIDEVSADNQFSENHIHGNHNIGVYDAGDRNAYLSNIIHNNDKQGIIVYKNVDCTLISNFIYANVADGGAEQLYLNGGTVTRCNVLGNFIHAGGRGNDAVRLYFTVDCVFLGNVIVESPGDGIELNSTALDTFIQGNHFWSNSGAGIRINNANCTGSHIFWNSFWENGSALIDNAGAGTILATYSMPFINGTTFIPTAANPWGYEIDAGGEYAIAMGMVPPFVTQIVRIKIVAVGLVGPGATNYMRLEITGEAGTFDEAYTAEPFDIVDKNNNEVNFTANDVISWSLTAADDADIGSIVGNDRIQIMVLHEIAGGSDIETDATFSSVEIEYV